jgi:hypothetical protein
MPHHKVKGVYHRMSAAPRIPAILTLFAKTAEYFFGGCFETYHCITGFVVVLSLAGGIGHGIGHG